ncbi:protein CLMP1-like [Vicia villosa]|uniref:protein CLMP1-like n=1 Tax=Vicia villosa TaxID=3911 RepID=UPI00273C2BA3|nr:protein CLMP1-like [Vicia villosa]
MRKSGGRRKKDKVGSPNSGSQPNSPSSPKSTAFDPRPSPKKPEQNSPLKPESKPEPDSLNEHVTAASRQLKLAYDHDIRLAQMPINCSFRELRDLVKKKFPMSNSVLIKYKDNDGDLVTITSTEELRLAESTVDNTFSIGILKLNIIEVSPEQEPWVLEEGEEQEKHIDCVLDEKKATTECKKVVENVEVDDWLYEFAQLFSSHVGASQSIDFRELGTEFCSEALEDIVTFDEAQDLFYKAEFKFQEVAALAFFNWGNVDMCAARKFVKLDENENEVVVMKESEFDFVKEKYYLAREKYERAVVIKPDFYEGLLAIGQQQFELAKLHWSFGLVNKMDLGKETLRLFDVAEEKMMAASDMWERLEEGKLGGQGSGMRSQINLFWGNMLFERSQVEFKLGMRDWKRKLDASVERFKIAGASPDDVSTVLKKHCSNGNARDGDVKGSPRTQNVVKMMK